MEQISEQYCAIADQCHNLRGSVKSDIYEDINQVS